MDAARKDVPGARGGGPASMTGDPPPTSEDPSGTSELAGGRTLGTRCRCGHERRDHTGLRIEVNGRCLDCDCEFFAPADDALRQYEAILRGMHAAIARVDRIQLIAEGTASVAARENGAVARANGAGHPPR